MAVKKQRDSGTGELSEAANDWFRQFLKHLELHLVATGQRLTADSEPADYSLAAMQAFKLTLLDAGMNEEKLRDLFGRFALANRQGPSDADTDAMGYPAGYFEATEGSFANERLDCPPDLPLEKRADRVARVERTLAPFISLPFDNVAARHYAEIRDDLESRGQVIGPNDLMIASIARSHELTVVSNNHEFKRVAGLNVADWTIPN